MTVQTAIKQFHSLDKRIRKIEEEFCVTLTNVKKNTDQSHKGLLLLSGIWTHQPRTARDLARVRKQLWR